MVWKKNISARCTFRNLLTNKWKHVDAINYDPCPNVEYGIYPNVYGKKRKISLSTNKFVFNIVLYNNQMMIDSTIKTYVL